MKVNLSVLLSSESPFRWEPLLMDENMSEIDLEEISSGNFSLINLADLLIRTYNEFENNNASKSLKIINEVEEIILNLNNDQGLSNSQWSNLSPALRHITYCTKAIVLLHLEEYEASKKAFELIQPLNDLNDENKAAIFAVRSLCLALYSYEGTKTALEFIKKALTLHQDYAYWYFLQTFYLHKLRKLQNPYDSPSLIERESIEKAHELDKNEPLFQMYLGDIYRETATNCWKNKDSFFWFLPEERYKKELQNQIEEMCKKSQNLFETCYNMRTLCPLIAYRSAHGLMLLPTRFQNAKLSRKILTTQKLQDSGFGNLVNGMYQYMFGQNKNLALKHLEAASKMKVFNAEIQILMIRSQDEDFDPIAYMLTMLETYKEAPKQGFILSQLVSYYIFVQNDQKSACEYAMRYYDTNVDRQDGNFFERHRSCFIKTKEPIKLIDVVADEVKFILTNNKLNDELKKFYTLFVHRMNFAGINVLIGKSQNLRQKIIDGKMLRCVVSHSRLVNRTKNSRGCRKIFKNEACNFKKVQADVTRNKQRQQLRNETISGIAIGPAVKTENSYYDRDRKHTSVCDNNRCTDYKKMEHQIYGRDDHEKRRLSRGEARSCSRSRSNRENMRRVQKTDYRGKQSSRFYRSSSHSPSSDSEYYKYSQRGNKSGHYRSVRYSSSDNDRMYNKHCERSGKSTRLRSSSSSQERQRIERKNEKKNLRYRKIECGQSESDSSIMSSPKLRREKTAITQAYKKRSISPKPLQKNSAIRKYEKIKNPHKHETVEEVFNRMKIDESKIYKRHSKTAEQSKSQSKSKNKFF